jgi:hypothetical protein
MRLFFLVTTLVATASITWNAKGVEKTSVAQTTRKEPILFAEEGFGEYGGMCFRTYDTYDLEGLQPGLLERIYALKKGRHPDYVFTTALSDSVIVRRSNGDAWLIRVFYTPDDHSPWKSTAWLGKLRGQEIPNSHGRILFTLPEVVPVRIPKALAGFMEPFRATRAVVSERKFQLRKMLEGLDRTVRESDGVEEIFRSQAESIRKYGSCCPGEGTEGQSDQDRATKLERCADEIRDKRIKDIETLNRLRLVIAPQLNATLGKTRSES